MTYLNQNMEGRDIPRSNLLHAADFPAEVWEPQRRGEEWGYFMAENGQPYPSWIGVNPIGNPEEEKQVAYRWAHAAADRLGVSLRSH